MTATKSSLIRDAIFRARQHEQETHQLEAHLAQLIPHLHMSIALPAENSTTALLQFVMRYIEHAPDLLDALDEVAQDSGIGKAFISIAQDFFVQPLEVVPHESGLKALIDEAYLTHRLIEELNDRLLMMRGAPFAPIDMTFANLVVHHLLGEEFANQLDLAVHYAMEALLPSEINADLIEFPANGTRNWPEKMQNPPCLAEESGIFLRFGESTTKETEH